MKDQFFYLRLLGPLIYESIRKYRRWIFGYCLSRYVVLRENENMRGETHANFWAKKMWFFYILQQNLIYHGSIFLWASAYTFWKIDPGLINFCFKMNKEAFCWIRNQYVCVSPLSYLYSLSVPFLFGRFFDLFGF